jgi:hypothetical protein
VPIGIGKNKEFSMNKKKMVFLSHSVVVPQNLEESFNFVRNLSKVYGDIAEGHDFFTTRDGKPLHPESIIDCSEWAGNQSIVHEYVVKEFIENSSIYYVSSPSKEKIKLPWKTIEAESDTHCWFTFTESTGGSTTLSITIGIEFNTLFEKWFSTLVGGLIPWHKHCVEEMEGLKRIMKKEAALIS